EAYPFAPVAMLADSAQGVVPPNFDTLRTESWNVRPPEAVFGSNPESIPTSELVTRLAQHYPADRFAQFTTIFDFGQVVFYDAMLNGLEGVQGTTCRQWSEQMVAELSARQQVANFRSYVAAGVSHMVLPGND